MKPIQMNVELDRQTKSKLVEITKVTKVTIRALVTKWIDQEHSELIENLNAPVVGSVLDGKIILNEYGMSLLQERKDQPQ